MNTVIFECSGIWPQMTQFDLDVLKPSNHPNLISNEQIGIRKSLKNGHVWPVNCAKISIFQVDFLEILNNFWTRYENFDKFVDHKEPECNLNMFFLSISRFFQEVKRHLSVVKPWKIRRATKTSSSAIFSRIFRIIHDFLKFVFEDV